MPSLGVYRRTLSDLLSVHLEVPAKPGDNIRYRKKYTPEVYGLATPFPPLQYKTKLTEAELYRSFVPNECSTGRSKRICFTSV